MMDTSPLQPFPITEWSEKTGAAVERISEIGSLTLATHRAAGEEAARAADQLNLQQRVEDERADLGTMLDRMRRILEALEDTRQLLFADAPHEDALHQSMRECSQTIDDCLPDYEQSFLEARHAALDLLLWTQRAGRIEGSELPERYRESYSTLISFTPVNQPRLDAMQEELLQRSHLARAHPEVQRLLFTLTRLNGVLESSRAFIRSVVDPPLELVFHETNLFLADWQHYAAADRGHLTTEFNDCCQLLLYDVPEFRRRVDAISLQVGEGLDASLVVLPIDDTRVIFSVDDDPVFGQSNVTLYRVVHKSERDAAVESVIDALYRGMSDD